MKQELSPNSQCGVNARELYFSRKCLPTDTCEVIYRLDDYNAALRFVSGLLFTSSSPPGRSVWGIAEKEESIFLHQIPMFQFGKHCCHFGYLNRFVGWGKSFHVCVDETILSDGTNYRLKPLDSKEWLLTRALLVFAVLICSQAAPKIYLQSWD